MLVEDIMTADPTTVDVSATLAEAFNLLFELDIRHLPVVEDERLIGMLSDRDLRSFSLPALVELEHREVARKRLGRSISQVMHADIIRVAPDDDVADLIRLMIDHKFGAVPVVDPTDDRLVGIVSYIDVLRAAEDLF